MNNLVKLTYDDLKFNVPIEKISELKKLTKQSAIIGQDRAVSAIKLGLGINNEGFNIFIMGEPGTGRRTVLKELLKDFKPDTSLLNDIAYIYNFDNPLEPRAIFFPAGKGGSFKYKLKQAITDISKSSTQFIKSESYLTNQKKLLAESSNIENAMVAEFETNMLNEGFKLIQSKDPNDPSVDLVPIIDGEVVPFDEIQSAVAQDKFDKKELELLRKHYFDCLEDISNLFEKLRKKREETEKQVEILLTNSITPIVENKLEDVFLFVNEFKDYEEQKENNQKILMFLNNVKKDLIKRISIYTRPFKSASQKKAFFSRYYINLICEHTESKNYVVNEILPNFSNLFGTIETNSGPENSFSNGHLGICPGAIHKAFGGYLILRVQDLLMEEDSWFYLKRVLQSGRIEIQTQPSSSNSTNIFKPESLPAHFKVILIGGESSYDILYQEDPDFYKLFKVCAEFDSVMELNDNNMAAIISLVDHLSDHLKTLKFSDSGYAYLIQYASRLSESRHLLTTQFTKISDLISEANYIAKSKNATSIDADILEETIKYKHYHQSLLEEKYNESLKLKETFIEVDGKKIGNINGLAVQDRGYYSFGTPMAISAQASPGDIGIVNIESESGLSGEIYYKAHLIISSLLRKKYTEDIPLSIEATLCFEQSYGMVEGDSASCAEFFALLSAIGKIPIRQDIAITGSLNQHGDVQPVGGVSEKIEGFFQACKILGFTGKQGAIIPESNKNNLFLSKEVLNAIKNNQFSIWTMRNIDDGIKIMSDLTPNEFDTIIKNRLEQFNEEIKKHNKK